MKNKIVFGIKLFFLALFTLAWFFIIQAEYEIIRKPELRSESRVFQGTEAVYFWGTIVLVLTVLIIYLLYSLAKSRNESVVLKELNESKTEIITGKGKILKSFKQLK